MNKLDRFIKHELKIKYYIRYADDFVLLSGGKDYLNKLILKIEEFLKKKLKLSLHENKIVIRKLSWGIDFLGYIILPYYVLSRTKTRKRIFRKIDFKIKEYKNKDISEYSLNQTTQSYLGYLSHANAFKLRQKLISFLIPPYSLNQS